MKIFIFIALVTLASASWEPKSREQLKEARLNCIKETNMSDDLLQRANRLEYPDSDEAKQFILCGARASELWDDSKGWLADRMILLLQAETSMDKEEMRKIIEGCLDDNSQGSSLMEWSSRNYKCIVQTQLKDSFLKIMKKIE